MKQIFKTLVLLLVIVLQSSFAQWVIERKDTLTSYQQVKFVDSLHGYIAGDGILSTTDAGSSWNQVKTGENSITRSLSVKNRFLWASTNFGTVYWSQDSGKTLNLEFSSNTPYDFRTIHFVDSLRGWLFGSAFGSSPSGEIILHTSDRGVTWKEQYKTIEPPSTPGHLYQGYMIDSLHGWAAHQYYMLHTFNGGKDWISQSVPDAPDLNSVFFIDTLRGWAVGNFINKGYIILTTDGGQHWSRGNSTIGSAVLSVFFADSINGWASCSNGLIAHSTDGGKNWTNQQSNTTSSLESVFFLNGNNGWAVGKNGVILHTTNGGGITSVHSAEEPPVIFSLSQNFPNPFNPTTRIPYSIAYKSHVDIGIYNVLGQLVRTLVQAWKEAGSYSVDFDGAELTSGVYFCRLFTYDTYKMNYTESKKMILLH